MEPQKGSDNRVPEAANDEARSNRTDEAGVGVDLQAELNAAREKSAQFQDMYLRARAEADNTRRRAQDEIAKTQKFAIESFAESLVPVADSLERALESTSSDHVKLLEGVQITLKQLQSAFERARLTEINPVGEKFDPHRHQAISTVPLASSPPGYGPNQVVAVLQKGWMIADRVLRPALVTVTQNT